MQTPRIPTLISAGVAVAGVLVLSACGGEPQQPPADGASPAPVVTVVTMKPEAVAQIAELPGRTVPYQIAELRPQVTGIVEARLFKEGSEVKSGQVLYRIAPATYQAAYDSARASLARAEANLEAARLKADRYTDLVKIQAVSTQANEEARAGYKQAQADVGAARAVVDKARVDLDHTRVASPIAGRIGRSTVTAGALVTANQAAAMATVQQLDPIYVDLTQSSAALLSLRRALGSGELVEPGGDRVPVQLVLEDGSTYAAAGKLAFSEVTVDEATGSVTLRAVFPNPKGELLPGMYVRARLTQGVNRAALLVPHAAVSRDPKGQAIVMLVNAESQVEARVVKTEQSRAGNWVVTEGLAAGDRVIVEGLQKAKPGARVQVHAAAAAAPAAR